MAPEKLQVEDANDRLIAAVASGSGSIEDAGKALLSAIVAAKRFLERVTAAD